MNWCWGGARKESLRGWMSTKLLILISFPEIIFRPSRTRNALKGTLHFDDGTMLKCKINSDSVGRILQTALFFGDLKEFETNEIAKIRFDCTFISSFDEIHEQQFGLLLDVIQTKSVVFSYSSDLSSILSSVLATRPYPIQLTLEDGAIMDVSAFLGHLENRQTTFGSLALDNCPVEEEEEDLQWIFDRLSHISRTVAESSDFTASSGANETYWFRGRWRKRRNKFCGSKPLSPKISKFSCHREAAFQHAPFCRFAPSGTIGTSRKSQDLFSVSRPCAGRGCECVASCFFWTNISKRELVVYIRHQNLNITFKISLQVLLIMKDCAFSAYTITPTMSIANMHGSINCWNEIACCKSFVLLTPMDNYGAKSMRFMRSAVSI